MDLHHVLLGKQARDSMIHGQDAPQRVMASTVSGNVTSATDPIRCKSVANGHDFEVASWTYVGDALPVDGDTCYVVQADNGEFICFVPGVAIGAGGGVGPAGPPGATGATGPAGPTGATGSTGPTGATGPTGPTGPAGSNGTNGSNGADGADGADGKTVLNGSGAPGGVGVDGDFYIDTAAVAIYGPKTGGAWGSSTSLVGPTGATGTAGATGSAGATGATGAAGADGEQGVPWFLPAFQKFDPSIIAFSADPQQGSTPNALGTTLSRWVAVWVPPNSPDIAGFQFFKTNTSSFTASTGNICALYSADSTYENLTLEVETADDGTKWQGTTNTTIEWMFTSAYTPDPAGEWVWIFLNYRSSAGTAPQILHHTNAGGSEYPRAFSGPYAKRNCYYSGTLTAAPATRTMAGLTAYAQVPIIALVSA